MQSEREKFATKSIHDYIHFGFAKILRAILCYQLHKREWRGIERMHGERSLDVDDTTRY